MPKKDREELPPPPYKAVSWAVLGLYVAVGLEGVSVAISHPWRSDLSFGMEKTFEEMMRVRSAQIHLCLVYVVEVILAAGPGWCAMSPGWTRFDLLIHHLPYISAVAICLLGGLLKGWTSAMVCVLLTPANEGLFIAQSLGAPECLAKFRRLIGFVGIVILFSVECWTFLRNQLNHWHRGGRDELLIGLVETINLGGIYYHFMLLRMYVRRWRKTRSL